MKLLDEVEELLRRYDVKPKWNLGQNFCVDAGLIRRMIEYSGINSNDIVLEIGAGFGFLTKALSYEARKAVAVELDTKLVRALKDRLSDRENVAIIEGDIFTIKLPQFNKIVSNPPYSISSQLILKLLEWNFDNAVLTLQEEFVRKLTAKKGEKDYGRLAVMAYTKADIEILERVPRNSFYPSPRVESAAIRLKPRKAPFEIACEGFFSNFVSFVFTQKNRKLQNPLLGFIQHLVGVKKKKDTRTLIKGIPFLEYRVYNLSPKELASISNRIFRTLVVRRGDSRKISIYN